jgi:hypothetical protein
MILGYLKNILKKVKNKLKYYYFLLVKNILFKNIKKNK